MISVCIATYNGANYVTEQIESILPQLNEEDELLISDDGSTDGTRQIIEGYAATQKVNVQIFDGPQAGLVKNFESLIQKATGDLIFMADQDDVWLPNKVSEIKAFFEKHADAKVVVSDLIIVDEQLQEVAPSYFTFRQAKSGFFTNLIKSYYIGAGMAFRNEMKQQILPFPKKIPMHDMWIGLLGGNQTFLLHESLTMYRRHTNNQSEIATTSSFFQKLTWRSWIVSAIIKRKMKSFFARNK